jgi:hypothetical protein
VLRGFAQGEYVIRKKGFVEWETLSRASCHTRLMADGTFLEGAQGNKPDGVVTDFLSSRESGMGLDLLWIDFAVPWIQPRALAAPSTCSYSGRHPSGASALTKSAALIGEYEKRPCRDRESGHLSSFARSQENAGTASSGLFARNGADRSQPMVQQLELELSGSSGRIRTYNPSVNSRTRLKRHPSVRGTRHYRGPKFHYLPAPRFRAHALAT